MGSYDEDGSFSYRIACESCGSLDAIYRELMDGVFCLDCYNQWVEKRMMEEPLPTIDELQEFNPYPAFWPNQGETAIKIIDSIRRNERIIGLSAPTASGKSGLLTTVSRWLIAHGFVDRVIYTTPQVKLVDFLAESGWFEYYMQNGSRTCLTENRDL
jgi:deoxyhypusine synthase